MDSAARRWPDYIYPYIKSPQVFVCPSVGSGELTSRGQTFAPSTQTTGMFFGYGYNYQYLGNSRNPTPARPYFPFTASESDVADPARTVAIADTRGVGTTTLAGTYVVDPPQHVYYADGVTQRGSGRSAATDAYYPISGGSALAQRSTPATRHLEMTSIGFADGHAKAMKPETLDDFNNDGTPDNGYFNGRGVADNRFYY